MTGTLAEAIQETPAPPCEPVCPHSSQCARDELACMQFTSYVRTGKWLAALPRRPSRALFKQIYSIEAAE